MLVAMHTLRLSFCFAAAFGAALAQSPDAGRRQYETRCSRCHGGDATGGESGPAIQTAISSRNDADLSAFIRQGRPASGMPAFALTNQEMSDLIPFLRS